MQIKFWGTRGSIPSPGAQTLEFGGNTTCVEVILDNGQRVVIDGGTGFRLLGQHLMETNSACRFHLLLTHGHWDHLLGIPFFEPIYHENTKVVVDGWPPAFQAMTRVFDSHMGDGFFPVAFDHLKARIDYLNTLAYTTLDLDGVLIDSMRLNHPQGGLAFRFREGQHTMIFITDNELGAARGRRIPEFVDFCRGCDLLIHDAQYLPSEIAGRRGWGHSTYEEVVTLAQQAEVHNLILTHHDPYRSDAEVEKIIARSREMVPAPGNPHFIDAAREGACYRLP
ncbi:MAG: MBL fold metallo-hydrolase [Thermodesulfobacteriota bacterium]